MIELEQVYKTYEADGTQRQWSFPYQYNKEDDITLYVEHNGVLSKINSSLYEFDPTTKKVTYPKDELSDPVPAGDTVLIYRDTDLTQEEDSSTSNFKSNDIERMVDKLTMICQELSDKYSRTISFNPTEDYNTSASYYIKTINDAKNTAIEKAGEASTSAANAAVSETAAANSASAAAASEQHTIQNEEILQEYVDQAEASATSSAGSANASAASSTQAATSATNAASSASDASDYADDASDYATSAQTYASNASTQATNAANSATAAASSATTASSHSSAAQSAASTATEKANAASASATAAAGSAASAGTSADNAATSALVASTSATAAQDALAKVQNYRRIDRTYIAGTAIDDYSGSLTVFDLGLDFDLSDYVVDVLVNGKGYQCVKAPVDFTVSGDVVTFVEAVPVGAVVQFRINASTTVIIAGSVDVDAKIAEHNTSSTAHGDIRTALTTHTGNANIHVTSSDKSNWNAKQAALSTTQLSATNSGVTAIKVSGYDAHVANGDIHVTASQKIAWNGKQDAISDLATIRSGAALGATAVQPGQLATVATTGSYSDLSGAPTIPTVDQTYNATSANAQSGVAVASAISTKADLDLANVSATGKATVIGWLGLDTANAIGGIFSNPTTTPQSYTATLAGVVMVSVTSTSGNSVFLALNGITQWQGCASANNTAMLWNVTPGDVITFGSDGNVGISRIISYFIPFKGVNNA